MIKTWKQSRDPDFEAKKDRILHLYGLMDGTAEVQPGDLDVVTCVDEFGPLNLQPRPAGSDDLRRWWADAAAPTAGHLHPPARRAAPAGRR